MKNIMHFKVWPSNYIQFKCGFSGVIFFLLMPAVAVFSFGIALIITTTIVEGVLTLKVVDLSNHKIGLCIITVLFIPILHVMMKAFVKVVIDIPLSKLKARLKLLANEQK